MELLSLLSSLLLSYLLICLLLSLFIDSDLTTSLYSKLGGSIANRLEGQVIWVTGASRGLGAALAVEAARCGARLVLSGRKRQELESVRARCLEAGRYRDLQPDHVMVLPLDLAKPESHTAAVRSALGKMTKVSCLLHCAARRPVGAWQEATLAEDSQVLQVNVLGAVNLARLLLPSMLERHGGTFSLVTSAEAVLGAPYYGSLAGSQRALEGFFTALHHEHCGAGIRVNFLCPGPLAEEKEHEGVEEVKGMPVKRAARLCLVAMAHKLPVAWIATYPVLTMLYFHQYFPDLCHRLVTSVSPRILSRARLLPGYGALSQAQSN